MIMFKWLLHVYLFLDCKIRCELVAYTICESILIQSILVFSNSLDVLYNTALRPCPSKIFVISFVFTLRFFDIRKFASLCGWNKFHKPKMLKCFFNKKNKIKQKLGQEEVVRECSNEVRQLAVQLMTLKSFLASSNKQREVWNVINFLEKFFLDNPELRDMQTPLLNSSPPLPRRWFVRAMAFELSRNVWRSPSPKKLKKPHEVSCCAWPRATRSSWTRSTKVSSAFYRVPHRRHNRWRCRHFDLSR